MHIIRAADCRRMPWKNGGGETVEIAVEPAGAALDAFDWRLSSATVATDGPFSAFAGVDRTLALLEGAGMELRVGEIVHRLGPGAAPVVFPGDVPTAARLLDGPITDLNMMTRRGQWRHEMRTAVASGTMALALQAELTLVFCAAGQVRLGEVSLAPNDLAILSRGSDPTPLDGDGRLYIVTLDRAGG